MLLKISVTDANSIGSPIFCITPHIRVITQFWFLLQNENGQKNLIKKDKSQTNRKCIAFVVQNHFMFVKQFKNSISISVGLL